MKIGTIPFAILAGLMIAGSAQAQAPALSADALARCATQVQGLRSESGRIMQVSSSYDAKREAINRRTQNLDAKASALAADDMRAHLALQDDRQRHNAETIVFNGQVEQLRRDIVAVNQLKLDYDRNCSNRPYRRADLDRLPEPARNAMRIGLSDISVPYLDGSSNIGSP